MRPLISTGLFLLLLGCEAPPPPCEGGTPLLEVDERSFVLRLSCVDAKQTIRCSVAGDAALDAGPPADAQPLVDAGPPRLRCACEIDDRTQTFDGGAQNVFELEESPGGLEARISDGGVERFADEMCGWNVEGTI